MEKIRIERTKSGLPAIWEEGGGSTNTGESTIVAGGDGLPKRAIYIKRAGHLSNGRHALIPLTVGDHIIDISHHRLDFRIQVYQVLVLDFEPEFAQTELVNEFKNGEWDKPVPDHLNAAIEAAMAKASCYHCREPFYIIEPRI